LGRGDLDFFVQPNPRPRPIVFGGRFRNVEDFGGFGNSHAHKISQLDQLSLGLVVVASLSRASCNRQELGFGFGHGHFCLHSIHSFLASTVAERFFAARLVNEYAPP